MTVLRTFLALPVKFRFVCALLLMGSGNAFALEFTITQFVVEGDNPISARHTQRVLAPYLGTHTDIEPLREATRALETALQRKGHDFHRVSLPPQTLSEGAVRLEITSLTLGKVTTLGNTFFSDDNLRRSLPQLVEGNTPNSKRLTRVLAVANNNTAKRTQLTFGRGQAAGTMDAQIEVTDSNPRQLYTWFNNTGTDESTNTRLGLGYTDHNLWDRDHQLRLSVSGSPEDFGKVEQYGLNYRLPVYQTAGLVNFLAAVSDADTGRVAEVYDVSGSGTTLGMGYTQILNNIGFLRQKVQLILLDKLFDNDVDFQNRNIGQDVRSRPLNLVYQGEWNRGGWIGLFNLTHSINQSGGSYNDDLSYALTRAGAPQDWQKSNLQLQLEHVSKTQWQTSVLLAAQATSDPLIPGEQLGFGGMNGPRGFEEREATFDEGYLLNLNLWMPPRGGTSLGAFYNIAHGSNHNPQPGQSASDTLASGGLGLRWNWRGKFLLDAYYGYVLDGIDNEIVDGTQEGDGKFHFNLMYRIK